MSDSPFRPISLGLDEVPMIRLDEGGRVIRTPAIDRLLEEVRGLLERDSLYSMDRARIATALELVDEEAKRLGVGVSAPKRGDPALPR